MANQFNKYTYKGDMDTYLEFNQPEPNPLDLSILDTFNKSLSKLHPNSTKTDKFQCGKCSAKFTSKQVLVAHTYVIHEMIVVSLPKSKKIHQKIHKCPNEGCFCIFPSTNSLNEHTTTCSFKENFTRKEQLVISILTEMEFPIIYMDMYKNKSGTASPWQFRIDTPHGPMFIETIRLHTTQPDKHPFLFLGSVDLEIIPNLLRRYLNTTMC
jgi:hypothetical protein